MSYLVFALIVIVAVMVAMKVSPAFKEWATSAIGMLTWVAGAIAAWAAEQFGWTLPL